MKTVIKRDGRREQFSGAKIAAAIQCAMEESTDNVDHNDSWKIAQEVFDLVNDEITVEQIQDEIEKRLKKKGYKAAAKQLKTYRAERTRIRNRKSEFMKSIQQKLTATNVQNQNANVDEHSFGGRRGEAASELTRMYALENCMSQMSRENHLNNEIYIHDLDSYAVGCHNCLTIPFDDLLAKGFNTRQTDIRPANSINTAFQLVAVLFQIQSLQQFGGVSASHLDWTMVPYVRRSFYKHWVDGNKYIVGNPRADDLVYFARKSIDDIYYKMDCRVYDYAMAMTKKELKQAVEGMYHNLNTLQSRSGNQLPFSSINYGTCTLPEGRMVIQALLEGSLNGVGRLHKTPIFPCGIFQMMKGVNREPGDPNYDLYRLALKSTAKRLYPNYANVDWSGNEGYIKDDPRTYFATMGCRTANGFDINGFGQLKDGRGNIAPVTIILPKLAMMARRSYDPEYPNGEPISAEKQEAVFNEFMHLLDEKLHEAKDMLIERFEWICSQPADSAKFMYENNVMAGYVPAEGIRSALKHGTLAVGQIGMAETLQILIGCDHTKPEGMAMAKQIEELFSERCHEFKEQYKLNFGVYYSPAENLCYTAMKRFKAEFGEVPNVSDRDYFTNSIHVPVWAEVTPFEKIDIESQLTGYSSAGCITYIEMDSDVSKNLDALECVVNYAMDKDIPYFAVNVPCDTCIDCGLTDDIPHECPDCGSKRIQRLKRVTGYLTGDYLTAFNPGKQKQVQDRFKHLTLRTRMGG